MKLYAMYLVKGTQDFCVGDNIKDFLDSSSAFKEERKLLDWSTDFAEYFREAGLVVRMKEGYFDWSGKYIDAKSEKELINSCIVICSASGMIKGIMCVNKNNREKL